MRGDDTRFLTGTDEHGQKVEEAANKRGLTPQQLVDQVAPRFDETWKTLGIDRLPTSSARPSAKHKQVVAALWKRIRQHNPDDLYLASYQGWYCVGCEAFYTESQLVKDGDAWVLRDPQDAGQLARQGAQLVLPAVASTPSRCSRTSRRTPTSSGPSSTATRSCRS